MCVRVCLLYSMPITYLGQLASRTFFCLPRFLWILEVSKLYICMRTPPSLLNKHFLPKRDSLDRLPRQAESKRNQSVKKEDREKKEALSLRLHLPVVEVFNVHFPISLITLMIIIIIIMLMILHGRLHSLQPLTTLYRHSTNVATFCSKIYKQAWQNNIPFSTAIHPLPPFILSFLRNGILSRQRKCMSPFVFPFSSRLSILDCGNDLSDCKLKPFYLLLSDSIWLTD